MNLSQYGLGFKSKCKCTVNSLSLGKPSPVPDSSPSQGSYYDPCSRPLILLCMYGQFVIYALVHLSYSLGRSYSIDSQSFIILSIETDDFSDIRYTMIHFVFLNEQVVFNIQLADIFYSKYPVQISICTYVTISRNIIFVLLLYRVVHFVINF